MPTSPLLRKLHSWSNMPNHVHGIIMPAVGEGYVSRLEWHWHGDMEFDFNSGDGWGVNRLVSGILNPPAWCSTGRRKSSAGGNAGRAVEQGEIRDRPKSLCFPCPISGASLFNVRLISAVFLTGS